MPIVITSKGKDFSAWRAAGDFGKKFLEELRERNTSLNSLQSEALFQGVGHELERRAADHEAALARMKQMTGEASACKEPAMLRALVLEYFKTLYEFFSWNRSATAFYQLGQEFMSAVAKAAVVVAKVRLGVVSDRLPPMAVVSMGPAGRHEFSPFGRLQLLLIHADTDSSLAQSINLLGPILHDVFEEIGLCLDEVITPRNPNWRGSSHQWRQRIQTSLERWKPAESIEILRLVDQSVLYDEKNVGDAFHTTSMELLTNSSVVIHNLVIRLQGLSGGIGIMGGIRLERSGPCRGMFALMDHALLPLAAGITALTFLHGVDAGDTPMRIRGLLYRGLLNVEMSERLLESWHLFNELRLALEVAKYPRLECLDGLCLDTTVMTEIQQDEFRQCLETVVTLQRHVGITFSGWQEQAAC